MELQKRPPNVVERLEIEVEKKKKEAKVKLEEELKLKKACLENMKWVHKLHTAPIVRKMRELEASLDKMKKKHEIEVKKVETDIAQTDKQLKQLNHPRENPRLEKEFECPVCLEVMVPPTKIFQCVHGHLICDGCKNHPEISSCPSCRVSILTSQFTRNIPMERLIRSQSENTK